jgi:hypothetical protein
MNINDLQDMWRTDSKINMGNLQEESLRVPELHSKYYDILNNLRLLKAKAIEERKHTKKKKNDLFTGKGNYSIEEIPNELYKARSEDLKVAIDGDQEYSKLTLKIEYYESMLDFVYDILKMIHNRTYQIKNCIDVQKFLAGF